MTDYLLANSVDEALAALDAGPRRILAGGTDFYPALGNRPISEDILDVSTLGDLRGVEETDGYWRFGALTTWTEVIAAALPPAFDGLKLAAREVGSVQIQNAGTIAGNLCNASPAADGVPPLLTLEAEVELRRAGKTRLVPLETFITGVRETARRDDELVTAVLVPSHAAEGTSGFLKLGARTYLVISIVMAAARIELDAENRIVSARLAVGACSPVAARLRPLEAALVGETVDAGLMDIVSADFLSSLSPIDDIRGSADYRLEAAATVVRRTLAQTVGLPS
jgi:CO/xanthine dehydrogenase FAD-binding subunit